MLRFVGLSPAEGTKHVRVAEWLGNGLQNRQAGNTDAGSNPVAHSKKNFGRFFSLARFLIDNEQNLEIMAFIPAETIKVGDWVYTTKPHVSLAGTFTRGSWK